MRLFLSFFVSFILLTSVAQADFSVGVVDVQALMTKSKAAISVGKQLEERRKVILEELSKEDKDLLKKEKELIDARKNLAEKEFSKKVQAFEKEKRALQKKSLAYRKEINDVSLRAERELMERVVTITGEVAAEKEYDLVLTKRNVIVGAVSLDITKEVLRRLDKKFPKVGVKLKQ